MPKKGVYYAVHRGRETGVFTNWLECKRQIDQFKDPVYRKFETEEEAIQFVEKGNGNRSYQGGSKSDKIKKAIEAKNQRNEDEIDQYSEDEKIYIYTDGSLIRKENKIYCGYGYFIPSKNIRVSRPFLDEKKTNNRAELTAILESIECLDEEERQQRLCIYTDSQYSIFLFTGTGERYEKNHWKNEKNEEVPNIDLIQKLLLYKRTYKIHLLKIRAHTDETDVHSVGNAMADRLANQAAQSQMSRTVDENPFRQLMFGETYGQDEYQRRIGEENENKIKEIRASDLFEVYDKKSVVTSSKKIEKKKVDKRSLKNTSLTSWFQEDD